jgi:hypothetical protein
LPVKPLKKKGVASSTNISENLSRAASEEEDYHAKPQRRDSRGAMGNPKTKPISKNSDTEKSELYLLKVFQIYFCLYQQLWLVSCDHFCMNLYSLMALQPVQIFPYPSS